MLRACVSGLQRSWDTHLPSIRFAYNNSYHSSIRMAPFKALCGRKCRSLLCWSKVGKKSLLEPDLVRQTTEKIKFIKERLFTAQSRHKSYVNHKRRPLEFEEGNHAFLRVTPTIRIDRALKSKKLNPNFIGPFQILKSVGPIAYQITPPRNLSNLHNAFHISQLRKYYFDLYTSQNMK